LVGRGEARAAAGATGTETGKPTGIAETGTEVVTGNEPERGTRITDEAEQAAETGENGTGRGTGTEGAQETIIEIVIEIVPKVVTKGMKIMIRVQGVITKIIVTELEAEMQMVNTGREVGRVEGEKVKGTRASTDAIETGGSVTQKTEIGVETERKRSRRAQKGRARRVSGSA